MAVGEGVGLIRTGEERSSAALDTPRCGPPSPSGLDVAR